MANLSQRLKSILGEWRDNLDWRLARYRQAPGERILYLHVGAGKTGTSALQSLFVINREALRRRGICYPVAASDDGARRFRITTGNGSDLARLLECADSDARGMRALIRRHVLEARGDNLLVSSEHMQRFRPEKAQILRRIVEGFGYRVRVVYYLRAIADYSVSAYHQVVKRHGYSEEIEQSFAEFPLPFLDCIQRSIAVFDAANVVLRNYDLHRDKVFDDFLTGVLGVDDVSEFSFERRIVNRSLSATELQLMRQLNRISADSRQSTFFSNALLQDHTGPEPRLGISASALRVLEDRYRAQLEQLNAHLPASERPLEMVSARLHIDQFEALPLNCFQKAVVSILAALAANKQATTARGKIDYSLKGLVQRQGAEG